MFGLIAALPREARAVRAAIARSGAERITLRRAGVGPARAHVAARRLLAGGATTLVSVGVAGALDPAFASGTALIPDAVKTEQSEHPTDAGLSESLRSALAGRLPLARGSLFGSDRVLAEGAHKRAIGRRFDCVAVDMESAAVGAAAAAAGYPFAAIRVIADAADDPIPALAVELIAARGNGSVGALLAGLWRRPGEIWTLLRLHRRYRQACAVLERALALCLPVLSDPSGDKRAPDYAQWRP